MITSILSILAAGSLVAPAVSSASSLLSGYGGPGEGNQAILGATLLNGPSGGSGGGAAGGGGSSANGGGELRASNAPIGEPRSQRSAAGHGTKAAKHSSGTTAARAHASQEVTRAYPTQTSMDRAVGSSGPLGLSGKDVLYVILALGALALAGALTLQLMRDQEGQDGTVAKGMRRRIRRTE
jgi:hypothetical protein